MSTASCQTIKTNSPIHGIAPPAEQAVSPSKPRTNDARVPEEIAFKGQTVRIYFQPETHIYSAVAKCGFAYVLFESTSSAAIAAEIRASLARGSGGWPSDWMLRRTAQ